MEFVAGVTWLVVFHNLPFWEYLMHMARQSFNIVHIQPMGEAVTLGHWDIARLLHFSFESLGYKTTLQINRFDRQSMNVVVGYELMNPTWVPAGCRYIAYQLEQLPCGGILLPEKSKQVLLGASEVWDYDPRNLETLNSLGVREARLLPLGYHEKLATIMPREEDVDVLFYGLVNERRRLILDELSAQCAAAVLQFEYGSVRDNWIARAKVVLNIHYYPTNMAEQVRVSYLLNNGKCVVSEHSEWDPLGQWCAVARYEELTQTCLNLLADELGRQRMCEAGGAGFERQPMAEHLRKILEV